jgi:hypothetical protein
MKINNTIRMSIKFILSLAIVIGFTFISSSSFAIAAVNINNPIEVSYTSQEAVTLGSEVVYDITLNNVADPMMAPVSYTNLEFKVTTPSGSFVTWTELQGYPTIPCTSSGVMAMCKSTDGNFQGGKMVLKMWLNGDYDATMDPSLCITIGTKDPKCKKLKTPKIIGLNKKSNLKLTIAKPKTFVYNSENFFNFKIANVSTERNFAGNIKFMTMAPQGTNITYVESDARLKCNWIENVVTCVNILPLDIGIDTSMMIKMKYWLPEEVLTPIAVSANITTDSPYENVNGNTDTYPAIMPEAM